MKVRTGIRFAQYGFIAIAIMAWGYCATVWLSARLYQEGNARSFDQELELRNRTTIPHTIPHVAAVPKAGSLVGRLEIPRIGISVMVVEGVGGRDLSRAVGHIPGTARPGQPGNVAIAGHRDTFFRPLAAIHAGDTMSIRTFEGLHRYRVVSTKVVRPDDVAVLCPTEQDTLTLVTCYPFYYVGAAPARFIVRGVHLPPGEKSVLENAPCCSRVIATLSVEHAFFVPQTSFAHPVPCSLLFDCAQGALSLGAYEYMANNVLIGFVPLRFPTLAIDGLLPNAAAVRQHLKPPDPRNPQG